MCKECMESLCLWGRRSWRPLIEQATDCFGHREYCIDFHSFVWLAFMMDLNEADCRTGPRTPQTSILLGLTVTETLSFSSSLPCFAMVVWRAVTCALLSHSEQCTVALQSFARCFFEEQHLKQTLFSLASSRFLAQKSVPSTALERMGLFVNGALSVNIWPVAWDVCSDRALFCEHWQSF